MFSFFNREETFLDHPPRSLNQRLKTTGDPPESFFKGPYDNFFSLKNHPVSPLSGFLSPRFVQLPFPLSPPPFFLPVSSRTLIELL